MLIEIANAKRVVKNLKKEMNRNRGPSDDEFVDDLDEFVRVKKK